MVVGPVALLAALFPAVFGGLAIMLRRWLVLLSVSCLMSTVYFVHPWARRWLVDTVWDRPAVLWLILGGLSALGVVWAGRRYRAMVERGEADTYRLRRGDRVALGALGALSLATVGYVLATGRSLLASPWVEVGVLGVSVWAGLLYLAGRRRFTDERGSPQPAGLSVETVMLAGLLLACTNLSAWEAGRGDSAAAGVTVAGPSGTGTTRTRTVEVAWTFDPGKPGVFFAAPAVAEDRVFIASVQSEYGVVYALDLRTGKEIWRFDAYKERDADEDERELKPVYCTPVYADGRVYVGEGMHKDQNCKLFCLDAVTGKPRWHFGTTSHTESAACVAGGRVYFGAGDDGVYCLDAETGSPVWHFQGLHVDGGVAVEGGRVFAGSYAGGDKYTATKAFCLDADTGKPVWEVPTDVSVFSPVLAGGKAFFGTGNGNVETSGPNPAGGALCFAAKTGRRLWRADAGDSVLGRPAVDRRSVYFGARAGDKEGRCYCVDRLTGQTTWKVPLGSPVVVGPTAMGAWGSADTVYVGGKAGRLAALNAGTGQSVWTFDVKAPGFDEVELGSSPVVIAEADGDRRRILFGTGLKSVWGGGTPRLYCLRETFAGPAAELGGP